MQEKLPREQAIKEITSWLDYKKVKPSTRDAYKSQIDVLVEALMYGELTMDASTYVLTHTLQFPVEGLIDSLKYKPRLTVGESSKVPYKIGDLDSKLSALVSALSGRGTGEISKLELEDFKVAQAVAVFFM